MGLPISVLARGQTSQSAVAESAARAVFNELRDVDAVFSPYRPDSVVSLLADGELQLSDCDAQVRDVAARCAQASAWTGGLFDATRPDGRWDPSGLVKGWAVERASRHLAAVPELDWCLNAGGDVVVLAPSGAPFTVGIQDPFDAARVAAVVACRAGAVATSGTAARGLHLYDPRSGDPAAWSSSVTVVGPSLESADVLATAAFVAGERALEVVAAVVGYEALRIDLVGALSSTAGWTGAALGESDRMASS